MESEGPVSDSPGIPLSYGQRGLWFISQLEGPRSTYNQTLVLKFVGHLDHQAMASAVADVTCRHHSLRTVFQEKLGEPYQYVMSLEEADPRLHFFEANSLLSAGGIVEREAHYFFDLGAEPPIRFTLIRAGSSRIHILLILIHHIATDGYSRLPLTRDLAIAYAGRLRGEAPHWTPLAVQYEDYAIRQRETLGVESDNQSLMCQHLAYWRAQLEGAPDLLQLPADRSRPPVMSHRGHRLTFGWDETLQSRIVALAREIRSTPFMITHAAVAVLLTRLGSVEDLILGATVAGRPDPALYELIGFFANAIVLRTNTGGNPTFRELALRVKETDLAAYEHQEMPFEQIVEHLNPPRSLGYHPIFQVLLTYLSHVNVPLDFPDLDVELQEPDIGVAKFDLTFTFIEKRATTDKPTSIGATLHYSSDLFDAGSADALVRRLLLVLQSVLAEPDRPIGAIDIVLPEEKASIIEVWHDIDSQLASARRDIEKHLSTGT